jgi:hypothetical protein
VQLPADSICEKCATIGRVVACAVKVLFTDTHRKHTHNRWSHNTLNANQTRSAERHCDCESPLSKEWIIKCFALLYNEPTAITYNNAVVYLVSLNG